MIKSNDQKHTTGKFSWRLHQFLCIHFRRHWANKRKETGFIFLYVVASVVLGLLANYFGMKITR